MILKGMVLHASSGIVGLFSKYIAKNAAKRIPARWYEWSARLEAEQGGIVSRARRRLGQEVQRFLENIFMTKFVQSRAFTDHFNDTDIQHARLAISRTVAATGDGQDR